MENRAKLELRAPNARFRTPMHVHGWWSKLPLWQLVDPNFNGMMRAKKRGVALWPRLQHPTQFTENYFLPAFFAGAAAAVGTVAMVCRMRLEIL